jgi:hypothetical protein
MASSLSGLFEQLRGPLHTVASRWASTVGECKPMLRARPWPAHHGRAADIARIKVADLTRDPELREMLAAELATWAANRWSKR